MSTRSIIVVTSKEKTVRVYKHHDGYPSGNLPVIHDALEALIGVPNEDVKKLNSMIGIQLDVDSLAQKILEVTELDKENLEATYKGPFKPAHLGNQGDLEWIYLVNLDNRSVNVYGGGYTGSGPQGAYKAGVVDPKIYAEQMNKDYKARTLREIVEAVAAVESLGFKLNAKRTRKAKAELGLS